LAESAVDSKGVANVMRENGTCWKLTDVVLLSEKPAERSGVVSKKCVKKESVRRGSVRRGSVVDNQACVWPYSFLTVGLPVARFCSASGRPLG
jgi:hypothetical protein